MKKVLFLLLALIVFGMITCTPPTNTPIVNGKYLKITCTGNYFNEATGVASTTPETLETIINLYTEGTMPGLFQAGEGIITGYETKTKAGGSMHANGFVAKGPLQSGSNIKIEVLDANFNPIQLSADVQNMFVGTLDKESKFSLSIPCTSEKTVQINANVLTTMQFKRVSTAIKQSKGTVAYDAAYKQAEKDILEMFKLDDDFDYNTIDFDDLELVGNEEGNSVLLYISAILANNIGIFDDIMTDFETDGELSNEAFMDALQESMMNLDMTDVETYLNNYYTGEGYDEYIPNCDPYEDADGDGVIDMYDVTLESPIGLTNSLNPTLNWTDIPMAGIEYIVEISTNPYFDPSETNIIRNIFDSEATVTRTLIDGTTYYWRVSYVLEDVQYDWVSYGMFTVCTDTNQTPIGTFDILEGKTSVSTEVITLDLQNVKFATEVRFSNDNVFDSEDEVWQPFEIYKTWILPDNLTEGADVTIHAEYRNSYNGAVIQDSKSIKYSHAAPSSISSISVWGGVQNNNGGYDVTSPYVWLDLTNVERAFLMKFSTDESTLDFQEWLDFESYYYLEIPDTPNIPTTVYAQFANSGGISATMSVSITLVAGASATLSIVQTGSGSITMSPVLTQNGTNGFYDCFIGDLITLTITPTDGYADVWGAYPTDQPNQYQVYISDTSTTVSVDFIALPPPSLKLLAPEGYELSSQSYYSFDSIDPNPISKVFYVVNVGGSKLSISDISITNTNGATAYYLTNPPTQYPIELEPNCYFEANITFAGNESAISETLSISSNDPNYVPTNPTFSITLTNVQQ